MRSKKNKRWALCLAVSFVAAASIGSCTQRLSGIMCLDDNANNACDDEESYLGRIPYVVTIDDEPVGKGVSYRDGFYEVDIKGEGRYCINVDLNSVAMFTPVIVPSPIARMQMRAATAVSTSNLRAATDETSTTDSSTSSDTDSSSTSDSSSGTTREVEPPLNENGKTCISISGMSAPDNTNVAVAMNFQASRDLSSAYNIPFEAQSGETSQIAVTIPQGCWVPRPVTLPPYLRAGTEWNTGIPVLDVISNTVEYPVPGLTGVDFTTAKPVRRVFNIVTKPNLQRDESDQMSITVACPDGKVEDLKMDVKVNKAKFPIELEEIEEYSSPDSPDGEYYFGQIVHTRFRFKNEGVEDYRDVELHFASNTEIGNIYSTSGGVVCNQRGQNGVCTIENLRKDAVKVVSIDITTSSRSSIEVRMDKIIIGGLPDEWDETFTDDVITFSFVARP